RVERVSQLPRLATFDSDGVTAAVVHATAVLHLVLMVHLAGLVADERVVGHLARVVEGEGDRLALLHVDRGGREGDVTHLDVDRVRGARRAVTVVARTTAGGQQQGRPADDRE